MLPMLIPYFPQRCILSTYFFLILADPFVRFFFVFFFSFFSILLSFPIFYFSSQFFPYLPGAFLALPRFSCALVGTLSFAVFFYIILENVVALARWGAIP
jgi:hypothetical protein